ncbi:methylmalonyl-CoA mutase family protein [Nocardioides sp. GCM10027113]|uniref:methylmalonyl-CoA mutase family protein n=1 Tax=unclassified Nocardioides TaxID=2615069 RepID=UPI003607E341
MSQVEGGLDEPAELEPEQGSLALAAPEDDHDRAAWEKAAAAVLRKSGRLSDEDPDAAVWDKLTRTTLDGIPVPPLGTPDLLEDLATSGRPTRMGEWDVRTPVDLADPKAANEAALVDLQNGATSLWLQTAPDADLATVLDGVLLDLAPVVLDARPAGSESLALAEAFLAHAGGRELHPGTNLGVSGTAADDALVAAAQLGRRAGVLAVVVDATEVHDRGASDAQELAHSLAVGARVLRVLTGAGLSVDEAARLVEFRYAATDEQFPTIAKLRAARRLWARVLELSDASPQETHGWAQRQHVVTSRPMMSKYDPWVNMLRTTVAAFAAGVGGADSVTVLPFDTPLGVPDAFGRRIARNTSSLLISESHLARVADPAGGAYAVEKLTDDLARAAWELFGRVEDGGSLDDAIAGTVARREAEVARRKRPLTGLTEFPNLAETLPERQPAPGADEVRRYGASFEALRDEPVEAHVFLATLGPIATHTARATFASNLLAAGGIAVDVAGPTADADAVVAAYDGQAVVCLAGADATYAEWGAEAAARLREAGARHVIIAGKPTDYADDSCAVGVDALDFLTRTRSKLA